MYITTSVGNLYPESMLALHLNFVRSMPPPLTKSPLGFVRFYTTHMLNLYTPQEQAGLKAAQDYQNSGGYYLHMMRTRPQTVGAMLADSPVALLAWIYEKLIPGQTTTHGRTRRFASGSACTGIVVPDRRQA